MAVSRIRRRWRVAALAVLTLLALELGLRGYAHATLRVRGVRYDEEVGWRMLPHVEKHGAFWGGDEPARTNAQGWRDAETPYAKPAGERRLIVLGDSFTFGLSADYGERFTELLEADGGPCVVNLGATGYGPDQALRVLEVEGLRYEPDAVVLVSYLGNDLDDVLYERKNQWPKPTYRLDGAGGVRLVPPRCSWDVRLRGSSYVGELLFRFVEGWIERDRRAPELEPTDPIELYTAVVRHLDRVCAARGVPCAVVLAFSHGAAQPPERERAAQASLEAAGVTVLETWNAIESARAEGEGTHVPDGHWSLAGHRVVAERIRAWLGGDAR